MGFSTAFTFLFFSLSDSFILLTPPINNVLFFLGNSHAPPADAAEKETARSVESLQRALVMVAKETVPHDRSIAMKRLQFSPSFKPYPV